MAVRAVRGATQLDVDDEQHTSDRVALRGTAHLRRDLTPVRDEDD
ncbi:hypothetical protein [Nocardioides sp. CER19]|nr:hypothetical protein [Nocardioides sp. CER19]MDH2415584.1 hypothetical protein [Nocardioides sp. CER19]